MGISPRHQGDAPEWADANCRAVLEAAPDAMLVVNRTGEIVAANQQATKLYGYSREHLIGRVVESLIPARLRDRHRQHRETFFANPEKQAMQVIEIFAVRSDASEIPVDVSLRLLTIGTETFAISAVRDATELRRLEELKRAEAVLRETDESEERFRLAAQAGKMYAYEWDVVTDLVVRSEEQVNVLGFREPTQLTRQELLARVHPEDRALFVASVDQLTPQSPTTQISYRLLRPDGSVVWLEKNARGFFDEQGKLLRVIGMVANITERKQAEEALRASEERLRLAQQIARIGTFDWNIRTGVNTWTPELEAMYGLPPGGFGETQTAFENLVHPNDRAGVIKLVDAAMRSGHPTKGEWRVVWADGSVHWIAGRWQVFMDASGEPSKMIGINIDITERKAAEEALHESEEQFRTLAEAIPQLCWMAHGDGHIFWYNQRWYTYTGTTPEQMEGWGWQSVHDPQALPLVLERWKTSIATGEPFDMVFPLRAADGVFHPFLTRITPVQDSKGSVVRWFGTNTDVTELRNAQEALSEMSRKLLQAQEQERARIARELHDDINQRLAMLGIELERLQDNPSEVRSRVQELRKQTTELSNDVQALSHDLHSSQLEYLGAVRGMKSWCKEFGERQGLQIEFKSPDAQISLPKEIGLCLFRVLQEALHNAAKHSGVRRIEVRLREDSGEIHLVVSDVGRGFDWETAMQGRGLGLTSMRERVRLVSGIVEIQSKPMCGTTVHVRVPVGSGADSIRAAG
jgi:PAS domain S-box-containing protein